MESRTTYGWPAPLIGLTAVAVLAGCGEATRRVEGECRDVYGADVCTWATFSDGAIDELGVDFPVAVAENVPEEMQMVWPPAPIAILEFPAEAVAATGLTHFELNWEHHGHPPQTFMEPHFDFHFYGIAPDRMSSIDCRDDTKAETLPEGYVLPDASDPEHGLLTGLCVPSMGMHAMTREQLASDEPFTATMLIGYYGGEVIFIEPMISRATLMEDRSFALDVPSLQGPTEITRYPSAFRADFDAGSGVYRLVFSGFTSG